jgi:ABC-type branched-subunit amino acid transport system substrate-binding protein
MRVTKRGARIVAPLTVATALLLGACGGGGDKADSEAQAAPDSATAPVANGAAAAPDAVPGAGPGTDAVAPVDAGAAPTVTKQSKTSKEKTGGVKPAGTSAERSAANGSAPIKGLTPIDSPGEVAQNAAIAKQANGVTDQGVTAQEIKLGAVAMYGMPLANLFITPAVAGVRATFASINDRGGVLGRRLSLVDCDDGPGEVSRSKACIKKMQGQDKVFALLGYDSWASASVHSDLAQYRLPAIGTWAYSQTEWQDPYMFPTHMSMIHEAMANAHWVKNVVQPKTYGLICLTSPEMQLACDEVRKILDASGAKLVKKLDVGISETSMSAQVLSMRAANPEHIVHYVINPATVTKFMVEAAQQNYYPPKGISGNHLAAEVLGSLFGKHPAGRYWTNTTYKLWGSEFMATMNKYARGNRGLNHHIVQSSYAAALIFERAAKAVGPNLTRERLMAQLGNGDTYASDASLAQQWAWTKAERSGSGTDQTWSPNNGQGHEYMYKYANTNTVSNPDGSPSGFEPDKDQFEIHTNR